MSVSVSYWDGTMSFEHFPGSVFEHKLSSVRLWIESYNTLILIYMHLVIQENTNKKVSA